MKNLFTAIVLSLFAFLAGCAVQPKAKISDETLGALQTKKVAITTFAPEKNVFYMETLYRVLWLEYKNNKVSYEGTWNIEQDLTPLYADGFATFGVKATPFFSANLKSYQAEFAKLYAAAPRTGFSELEKLYGEPSMEFYKSAVSVKGFDEVKKQLQDEAYDYLIELYIPTLVGNAPGYGMVVVGSRATMNLIDVKSGAVLWTGPLPFSSELYQLGGDLRALEKDNLKLLKEGVVVGIKKNIERGSLKSAVGYP